MSFTGKISKDIYRGDSYVITYGTYEIKSCTKVSAIKRTAKTVKLPDDSMATSTRIEAGTVDITIPAHADADRTFLNAAFNITSSGNTPAAVLGAYVPVTITQISNGGNSRVIGLVNCFISDRTEPELDMSAADQMTSITYTITYDEGTEV